MEKKAIGCFCAVEVLLKTPFKNLKLEEKRKFCKMDRPTPILNLEQVARKGPASFIRHFRVQSYQNVPWLCGCLAKNALFCWPCLLFAREETVWNLEGYRDLKNLNKCVRLHSSSSYHLLAMMDMKKFKKLCMKEQGSNDHVTLSEEQEIELHNIKVEKGREILKRVIKVVVVLVKLGYVFNGSDSENVSSNWEEVLKLVATYDNDLKSLMIENNGKLMVQFHQIITALHSCMLKEIKREISETVFVMLIFDSVVDDSSKSHIATTLRYIKKNGKLVERFLHFTEWPKLIGSSAGFDHILKVLKEFDCNSKLVGYTYDGSMISTGEHAELKEYIRKENRAIFIHYYGHNLSNVLIQALSHIQIVKIFFASLEVIGNLFLKPSASKALEFEIKIAHPNVVYDSLKWNDPIRRVEMILNHRMNIASALRTIIENPEEHDADIVASASSSLLIIRDFDFKFLLLTFQPVFFRCDIIFFQILQAKMSDPEICSNKIKELQSFLLKLSVNFKDIWQNVTQTNLAYSVKLNRMYKPRDVHLKESYHKLYKEIFNVLTQTITDRFGDISKQNFLCLLNQKMFKKHRFTFPPSTLSSLTDQFLCLFSNDVLKNELIAIYSDADFVSTPDIHGYLMNQELDDIFPQTYKFSKFLTTLPLDSKFTPVSERIQNFVRMGKNLNNFPLFVIERELLDELLEHDSFIDQIIDEFAVKAGRIDLIYKGMSKYSILSFSTSSANPDLDPSVPTIPPDADMEESETDPNIEEPGPSYDESLNNSIDESKSFLTEESITCIHIPDNEVDYQALSIKIKQEPEANSSLLQNFLTEEDRSSNQSRTELTRIDRPSEQSLFQPLIGQPPIVFQPPSFQPPIEQSLFQPPTGQSLFQPPVLIKQEIVSSEDEL